MYRLGLAHILLCSSVTLFFMTSIAVQDHTARITRARAAYQKWLDQDTAYIITNDERTEFAKPETDQRRNKFIESFWQCRNPNPDA